jgi:hypothetical protein
LGVGHGKQKPKVKHNTTIIVGVEYEKQKPKVKQNTTIIGD